MAFPDGLTLVTVHCQLAGPGRITFFGRYTLVGPDDDSIQAPFNVIATLDAGGEATVQLPATNDPQWSPTGWAYAVRGSSGGGAVRGSLQLDYQTLSVELSDLLQVDGTAQQGQTYIPLSQRSIAGGVAGLDVDGDVIDASGSKVTGGGGGGGPSPSGTVASATSYGTSATAGAASAYSRGDHNHGSHAAPASTDISDATTTGKAVLTAASQATARTAIGAGTSSLAIGTSAGTAAEGNDSRLSDARTPTAHATTHQPGGSDAMAVDQAAATASLRTLGTGSTQAAAGNHNHTGTYQPLDSDLTTIAGLTPTTGNFMVAAASAWSSATPSAAKTALGLAASDVGLGNVANAAQVQLSTLTAKGDLLAATGSAAVARVAAGSNGTFLVADSGQSAGVKWFASAPVLVLGPVDSIPGGTPAGTVIVRTAT